MVQTNVSQRIHYLDILRGISVLFIFVANSLFFSGFYFLDDVTRQQYSTYELDKVLDFIIAFLIEAKFYTLFSLLFGIGYYIQFNKFKDKTEKFAPYITVRLAILLVLGLTHVFLLWMGDIITLYALLGLLLIFFINLSNKALLIWFSILILLPIAHTIFLGVVGFYPGVLFGIYDQYIATLNLPPDPTPGTPLQFLRMEDLSAYMQIKVLNPLIRFAIILADARPFKVFAIFLLGIVLGRKILHENLLHNTDLLKRILMWGGAVGLFANVFIAINAHASEPQLLVFKAVAHAIGVVPLALAYAAGIALAAHRLNVFAPVGRMAFTCYILQSVFGVILFVGVGFGLIDEFGLTGILLISALVLVFEIILCHFWLRHFKQGPIESLWRKLIPQKLTN